MGTFYVGISGFASPGLRASYGDGSRGASDLLSAYAQRFDALEMDSSFQRPPSRLTLLGWTDATPDSFAIAVRVPRDVTHLDRLGIPARSGAFVRSLEPLGPRLRCVLFTTPPSLGCDVQRFRAVLDAIPPEIRTAWEFRDQSWLCAEVLQVLRERGSAPVVVENLDGVLGERMLETFPTPAFTYVRLRKDPYTYADIVAWGETLTRVLNDGRDVYAFFKQTPDAPMYATALCELLLEAGGVPASAAATSVAAS